MSGGNIQEALKESGHGSSGSKKHDRVRATLVVSEVALACVLLVGAGLLLRSFLRVLDVDLGFEPSRAAAVSVDYGDGGSADKRTAVWQDIVRRIAMIPGAEAVGITDNLPMSRNRSWGIRAKGGDYDGGKFQGAFVYIVSPGYLKAIGMRLLRGRDIGWEDAPKTEKVVIINETVARKLWPGQDPIGCIADVAGGNARVIGVIADVRESNAENGAGWQMYLPVSQSGPEGAYLVVRSKLPPAALAPSVMRTLRQINPEQPATEFKPIQNLVDHATSPRRFFMLLVSIFAGLGLLLASLGIYGVISYSVTRQTQEIGIRMALGATPAHVLLGVITNTLRLALAGIVLGMATSFVVARLIASLLFGTAPTDPVTFATMALLLCGVACLAGFIPARRAACIDPMRALRNI
jgi:predicted permease